MKLGDKLKEIRIEKGLTVSESAEGAWINKKYLLRIERNAILPSFPVLYNLADFYEADLNLLLKLHPRYTGKEDTIYDRIKDLAIKQGIYLNDITEMIGVNVTYLCNLKRDIKPQEHIICKLAKALGTTTEYLLEGENHVFEKI